MGKSPVLPPSPPPSPIPPSLQPPSIRPKDGRYVYSDSCVVSPYLASRIRGKVAQVAFDEFHRYSTSLIKKAVFGVDKDGVIKQRLRFDANQLVRQ